MKRLVERFLPQSEQQKIESCIREAESRTRGEIMVLVEASSYHYPVADLRAAAALAFPIALALTPFWGGLFWAGPSNLWIFMGTLIPLFLVFHAIVKHVPPLKRIFISDMEMEAEVQEAAEIQFYKKGVYRTREETGVLIYVSVFERKVRVLGDRGLNARIPEGYWKDIVATIVPGFRKGRPAESICQAVARISDVLEEKFPVRMGDKDELKNLIVEDRRA
ncbi:MAG: TPM domain-containing protein [Deltaproteobacteria bacterium]|nr:TPM domain-containing protein [Deltaproteobacteria bacterium]